MALTFPIGFIQAYAGPLDTPELLKELRTKGWLLCDGEAYPQSKPYDALWKIIRDKYNSQPPTIPIPKDHFRVPNLQGRTIVGAGSTPDLTPRPLGAAWGEESVKLGIQHLPSHSHAIAIEPALDNVGGKYPTHRFVGQGDRMVQSEKTGLSSAVDTVPRQWPSITSSGT